MVVDIQRSISGEFSGSKQYTCEKCGQNFIGTYTLNHSVNKSADLFKSIDEEMSELREQHYEKMILLAKKHQPAIHCPSCKASPVPVVKFYKVKMLRIGAFFGAATGLATSIGIGYFHASLQGFSEPMNNMSIWSICGFVPGGIIGGITGYIMGIKAWPKRDKVYTAEEWARLKASGGS